MNRLLHHAAFAAGLLAVAWVGAGYFPGHPLALSLVLLIGAFYFVGAFELHRFQQATATLQRAIAGATEPPASLAVWLAPVDPGLHASVRLRVEGERVALPGPALTPYLSGLLVLLGMLGTFLGMVVTLKGTGLALEHATDVAAIRASLSAPVQGLGLAFGCSVAGVAASAMLGLMSALVRRDRGRAVQSLDTRVATTLRGFSQAHQREESLRLLRAQADAMPAVVTQLQGLVEQLAQQGRSLNDSLLASQASFQAETQRAYTGLAESVDRSLKASLADSARLAGAAIEPAVQATMAGLAREAAGLRETLAATAQQQLDTVTARLDGTATMLQSTMAGLSGEATTLRDTLAASAQRQLDAMTARFDTTHATLQAAMAGLSDEAGVLRETLAATARQQLDTVTARLDATTATLASTMAGLSDEAATLRDTLAATAQQQLDVVTARLESTATTLADGWQGALADQQRHGAAAAEQVQAALDRVAATFEQRATALVDGVAARLDDSTGRWSAAWGDVLAQQRADHAALVAHTRDGWSATQAGFERHAAALLQSVADAQTAADTAAATREGERLAAFHDGLARSTATLQQQAVDTASALADRQQQICATLESTAQAITAQAEAHARATIDEISRLVQAASEAPRAAAEVIGELRGALSDSLVRDNAALDERNRLLSTLSGLLDAVNHASTEQRAAIDALVSGTTEVMERVGARFHETVAAESRSLEQVAAQVTVGAAEVAGLGEGFGVAVDLFSRASEQLMGQLQRIEAALGQSMARSDEQLAYYVAQAREIVDLTLGSQKQIVEDLQQIGRATAPEEADAA